MEQMTKRERLLAALHGQPVDRVPWSPLIDDYFISSLRDAGRKDAEIISVMREIGNDILERHVPCVDQHMENVEIRYSSNENDTVRWAHYTTPVGNLTCEWKFSGHTWALSEHLIKTVEDMKTYQYIAEHTTYTSNFQQFIDRDAYIGDDGIPTASGPMSPILELLQMLCGIEPTVFLMMDYPDEMNELLHALHERNLRQYRVLAESPALAVFDYEDTSTTFMNRSMLNDLSIPAFNDYADIIKGAGKIFITHMCGSLSGFAEDIGKGRQDGVDSVCPPDTGDLCPWDARAAWGKKIIIGGICPPDLARLSVRQNLQIVYDILMKMPTLQGFILCTGDATPYGTPVNNLRAITRLIEALGPRSLTREIDQATLDRVAAEFM